MRWTLALLLLPLPATAWEATIADICTLTHETAEASVTLLYDPSQPIYSITVTRKGSAWAPAPVFGMRFDGQRPNVISTDRHVPSNGGASLTVTDRGFGNVLDGLQFNETATAFAGDLTVTLPLAGAGPAVQAFRDCAPVPAV